jgi:hypothetical protein
VGIVAQSSRGHNYSTQAYLKSNKIQFNGNTVTITAPLVEMNKRLPTPFQFAVLRLLNITIMRNLSIGNWLKKKLVRLLITQKKIAPVYNQRTIHLGPEIRIKDEWEGDADGFVRIDIEQPFSAIHMASQGYWQKQDDEG